jgi:cyclophilin family peptidyl-prolyl cis-trans isomerase
MRDRVLAAIPYPVRVVVGVLAYRGIMSTLHGQGTARFSAEEIAAFRHEIWEGIAALATEARRAATNTQDPFWILGGKHPTDADTTVFGFIVSGLVCSA